MKTSQVGLAARDQANIPIYYIMITFNRYAYCARSLPLWSHIEEMVWFYRWLWRSLFSGFILHHIRLVDTEPGLPSSLHLPINDIIFYQMVSDSSCRSHTPWLGVILDVKIIAQFYMWKQKSTWLFPILLWFVWSALCWFLQGVGKGRGRLRLHL